jgi:Fungal trichothecene efflux pump (TRI12)
MKIPEQRPQAQNKLTVKSLPKQLDLTGFVLFAGFAVMFLLALEWGGVHYPWGNAKIIGLFCGSGGVLIIFGVWEHRAGEKAMIPWSVLKKTTVWSACLVVLCFFGSMLIQYANVPSSP